MKEMRPEAKILGEDVSRAKLEETCWFYVVIVSEVPGWLTSQLSSMSQLAWPVKEHNSAHLLVSFTI